MGIGLLVIKDGAPFGAPPCFHHYINISMGSLGAIVVDVSEDGFTTVNSTLPTHIPHDGVVERAIDQLPDGSWIVTTHGYGNNETRYIEFDSQRPDLDPPRIPVNLASLNAWGDPILPEGVAIFDGVDEQILNYIQANHYRYSGVINVSQPQEIDCNRVAKRFIMHFRMYWPSRSCSKGFSR